MMPLKKVPRPTRRDRCLLVELDEVPGGGWHHVILDGKPTAVAYCPFCGKRSYLDGHEIDSSGSVTPSVICPHAPCLFHETVQLENYEA